MTEKKCPICKELKNIDEFDKYFSKERQKYRVQNYCKVCQKSEKSRRSKEYYRKHHAKKLQYSKTYRQKPENKEKIKALSQKFKKKYREELQDCYVREQLVSRVGYTNSDLHANPEIVEAKRTQILINRKIKQYDEKRSS